MSSYPSNPSGSMNCTAARRCSNSQHARNQLGARHIAAQHISLLNRWLSLAPAVLPSPEYCTATLSHPDLHAGNIFINNESMASVRPLFETSIPQFVDIDTSTLVYAELPAGGLDRPILPDNLNELSDAQKLDARTEITQILSEHRLLELINHMHPALYASLPLLEQTSISLTTAYGGYIPVNPGYPACPVSFSEEDIKRHENEFKDIIHAEEWLDSHFMTLLKRHGVTVYKDGSVDEEIFEEARKKVDECFVDLSTTIERERGKERAERFRRHWPLREGKFVHSMESCM